MLCFFRARKAPELGKEAIWEARTWRCSQAQVPDFGTENTLGFQCLR